MLDSVKYAVCEANKALSSSHLVILTWGNVSAFDQDSGLVVIKPSGVDYSDLSPEKMVVVDLEGKIIEGNLRPSSDTPTHLMLYRNFKDMRAITHTHSCYATSFAQAGVPIPILGTTHADYFYGEIPCSRHLSKEEVTQNYEINTGKVIVETLRDKDIWANRAVLVRDHGVFVWGKTPAQSVEYSLVLENIAQMAINTRLINPGITSIPQYMIDKHYFRKHGVNAYYGQK